MKNYCKKAVDFIIEGLKGINLYKTEIFLITEEIRECTRCHHRSGRKVSTYDGKTFSSFPRILNKIEHNNCHKEKKDCVPYHYTEYIKKDCIYCNAKEINSYQNIHIKEMELKCNECHEKTFLIKEVNCLKCHS